MSDDAYFPQERDDCLASGFELAGNLPSRSSYVAR